MSCLFGYVFVIRRVIILISFFQINKSIQQSNMIWFITVLLNQQNKSSWTVLCFSISCMDHTIHYKTKPSSCRVWRSVIITTFITVFILSWMQKKWRPSALSVETVEIRIGGWLLVIFKNVIGLTEGENFILILDDSTMSLVNSVCGQFALLDRGCIRRRNCPRYDE